MADTDVDSRSELAAGDDDSRFLVHNPQEIARIMRGLIQRRELVSAFFNGGEDLMLTAVLDIDAARDTLALDCSGNEALNQRLLEAEKVIFVTALDRVKVQFVSRAVRRGVLDGRPAFLMAIPQQVLQLQRREYYRLRTPIANPLKCRVPLADQQFGEMVILDISAGGIGILVEQMEGVSLEVGSEFPGCSIELPGIATLEVTLRIQNRFEATLKNGHKALRCGCQFISLHPALQASIQRYIVKLQRERIANTPGH